MCEIYKLAARDIPNLDWSDEAKKAMFEFESKGIGNLQIDGFSGIGRANGYAVGKKWMDINLAFWQDPNIEWDELYKAYPAWFLDKIRKERG